MLAQVVFSHFVLHIEARTKLHIRAACYSDSKMELTVYLEKFV